MTLTITTCTVCGEQFSHPRPREARRRFLRHALSAHEESARCAVPDRVELRRQEVEAAARLLARTSRSLARLVERVRSLVRVSEVVRPEALNALPAYPANAVELQAVARIAAAMPRSARMTQALRRTAVRWERLAIRRQLASQEFDAATARLREAMHHQRADD